MSLSSQTTVSDDTITPSTFQHSSDLESSTPSLEFSAATTACNTFSDNRKLKPHFNERPLDGFRRRPFQRLPIPTFSDDLSVGVQLGFGLPASHKEETEEESFPQSPGHSPLSRFQHVSKQESVRGRGKRYSLSPPSVKSGLRLGLRRKHSRNRSASDAAVGRPLHPSPPPCHVVKGQQLEPEDLVAPTLTPKKKVLKRKPIPASLFVEAQIEEKHRSWSVPDIFSGTIFDEDSKQAGIQGGNQLGLFLPSTSHPIGATVAVPIETTNAEQGLTQDQAQSPPQPRLRRATRSISESYGNRTRRASLSGATYTSNFDHGRRQVDKEPGAAELERSPTSTSSSEEEGDTKRGRTRSGSAPVFPASQTSGRDDYRRFSVGGEQQPILRRVSRRREGEMRSVYLSRPSPPPSASPCGTHYTALPIAHLNFPVGDSESVEVLKTPDPPSQPFSQEYMSSSLTLGSHMPYDSVRSTRTGGGGSSWDGSFASRARSSSETSMASLLVLQQHIQQRNHLRQFAPPVADPYLPAALSRRSREPSAEEMQYVVDADARRKDARVQSENMAQEESKLMRQYGAMRIKNWPGESDECELPYLAAEGDEEAKGGKREGGGLRHMFSQPLLATQTTDGTVGSLRERRAKPPISIALAPAEGSTTNAVVMGAAIPLRKKISRGQLLSPTASIHSPPPCPPPATPLPELPAPKSAPIVTSSGPKRILLPKRSFIRSSSTPVSPLNATPMRQQHSQTKSQGDNSIPPHHLPTTTIHAEDNAWSDTSLLTPPLTGVPSLVFDQQPNTPLSAATAVTPVRPTAGKFDSLFAFLSSKSRVGNDGDADHRGSPRPVKTLSNHSGQADDVLAAASATAPTSGGIVYGLAL